MASISSKLESIYSKIPPVNCREGCTDCCGIIWMIPTEQSRFSRVRKSSGMSCPYLGESGCTEYDHRPYICRLFGASNDRRLLCPHGCRAERPLSVASTSKLTRQYKALANEEGGIVLSFEPGM